MPARFHEPPDAGSNPASATSWAAGQTVRRRSCKAEIGVRFPGGPLIHGPVVQRDDITLAWWECGFDSRRVHSSRRAGRGGAPVRQWAERLGDAERLWVRLPPVAALLAR